MTVDKRFSIAAYNFRSKFPNFGNSSLVKLSSNEIAAVKMRVFFCVITLFLFRNFGKTQTPDCYQEPGVMQFHACCDIPFTSKINEKCKQKVIKRSQNDSELEAEIARYELAFEMCTAECEFQAKNYLHGSNDIDFETVKKDLEKCFPHEFVYIQTYIKGLNDCLQYARNRAMNYLKEGFTACNYFPGLLRKCAFHAAIQNCSADRWHFSTECNEIRSWLEECNVLKNF